MKNFFIAITLLFFFASGLYISLSSSLYQSSEFAQITVSSRDPAAIKKIYDFSELEGSALSVASKQRLLSGMRVVHQQKDVGLELGHFVIKAESGDKAFACQKYNKLTMTFKAEGMAVSGELPTMELEGGCEIASHDINSIAPIWIPVEKIITEPVGDGEYDFKEEYNVRIKFTHVTDQWPTSWALVGLKLSSQEQNSEMFLELEEIKKLTDQPIIINW